MKKSLIKQKKSWTDEERKELCEQLDAEFEAYLQGLVEKNEKKTPEEQEASMEEMLKDIDGHPAFMRNPEDLDLTKPLHPALEGLMAIKYESENPTARADSYREDGNDNFQKKKYRIAIQNYTEAIKSKSPDRKLNAVCYSNRAAAQFHLGNYGSAFRDCVFARKFQPDHWKAIMRGVECCMKTNKYPDAVKWIDAALLLEPGEEELTAMRARAEKYQKERERDDRKQAAQERKEAEEDRKLLAIIHDRGIKVGGLKRTAETAKLNPLLFTSLEAHNPTGAKVYVDEKGVMFWPVLLFYPEHGQTDFIQAFNEHDIFADHLLHMFGPNVPPATWDEEKKYKPESLEIFFEDRNKEELHKIDPSSSLLHALQNEKYTVFAGTPCFIILVSGSKCWEDYLKRYNYKI